MSTKGIVRKPGFLLADDLMRRIPAGLDGGSMKQLQQLTGMPEADFDRAIAVAQRRGWVVVDAAGGRETVGLTDAGRDMAFIWERHRTLKMSKASFKNDHPQFVKRQVTRV